MLVIRFGFGLIVGLFGCDLLFWLPVELLCFQFRCVREFGGGLWFILV